MASNRSSTHIGGALALCALLAVVGYSAARYQAALSWTPRACQVESTRLVSHREGDEWEIELQLSAEQQQIAEPVSTTRHFAEREDAQRAAAKHWPRGKQVTCYAAWPAPDRARLEPASPLRAVGGWVGSLYVLAHVFFLLGLERRDRRRKHASAPPRARPAWLPEALAVPAPGFLWSEPRFMPRGNESDRLVLSYVTQGSGSLVSFFVVAACFFGGVPLALIFEPSWYELTWGSLFLGVFWLMFAAVAVFMWRLIRDRALVALRIEFSDTQLEVSMLPSGERFASCRRDAVEAVVVKFDRPESDSFPTWGLMVEADKTISLLQRQARRQAHWLGEVLVAWSASSRSLSPRLRVEEPVEYAARALP